jgi:hypothetical protein
MDPSPGPLRLRRDGIPAPLVTHPGPVLGATRSRGLPEAPVFGLELWNLATVPVDARWCGRDQSG